MQEWSSTTEIAKLLGKTIRRVQWLTQEGVLETEVPPNGGTRKYRTYETVQRYMDYARNEKEVNSVEIRIIGEPKEIAALVVETQGRLCSQKSFAEIVAERTEEYKRIIASQKATDDTGQEVR